MVFSVYDQLSKVLKEVILENATRRLVLEH